MDTEPTPAEPFRYDAETEITREIERGEFDGYRAHGDAWADD